MVRIEALAALMVAGAAACGDGGAAAGLDAGPAADAAPAGPRCAPAGGGPYWIAEGETVTFTAACTTGLELRAEDFAFTDLPDGARWDRPTATVTWTPRLDQAAVVHIGVRAIGEEGNVKIGVADAWEDPANVPVVDPLAYPEEYGLPVIFVSAADPPLEDDYEPAIAVYRGFAHAILAKRRGNTSLDYPKNSYTLKFPREAKFSDPAHAGRFLGKRKIVLTTTFDDNSYLRQRLAYEVWPRLDARHVQVQSYHVVVYLEGEYHGLYLLSDHVDGFLMEDHGLWQDGNLYKAVTADANFGLESLKFGGLKETLHQGFEKKEGFPEPGAAGAFDDLDELVEFVATSDDAVFRDGIVQRLAMPEYQDWWILVTFLHASDSAGKNAYHYHDPTGASPWHYVPWDFNSALGQSYDTRRRRAENFDDYTSRNELFRRFLAEPTLAGPLRDRYRAALAGPLAAEELVGLVDAYAAEIRASALRDQRRWGEAYRDYPMWSDRTDFLTFEEEVAYVREWILTRWGVISERI